MYAKSKDLWVFVETGEDGSPVSGLDLLNPGKELAGKQGGALTAVIIGGNNEAAEKACAECGADKIITIGGEEYARYTTDAYSGALGYLVEKYRPETILIGATANGRDLAPRIASRFDTGIVADCIGFEVEEETGNLVCMRPISSGSMIVSCICPGSRPQIASVRLNTFKKSAPSENRAAERIREKYHVQADSIRTVILEVINNKSARANLEDAEIIVSGGRGTGGEGGFVLLRELADVLGGVVAASRAATDEGWIPSSLLIGQTGKSVAPKLYIACGISGALQHVCGMSDSDVIVAINRDANAPIFEIADYGVVGDMFKVVPAFIEEVKKARA